MGTKDAQSVEGNLSGRSFVLLQGPSSFFFSHVGEALRRRGAKVLRIGFCPGDRVFWRRRAGEYMAFRGGLDDFPDWLSGVLKRHSVTDLVMLGDGRAPHHKAISMLKERVEGPNVWIVEHGYLRPNLILIEPDGMGGGSNIPQYQRLGVPAVEPAQPTWSGSFLRYAIFDVTYHLSNVVFAPFSYPRYRAHSGIHPFAEYAGWIKKALRTPSRRSSRQSALDRIGRHAGPVFLYPLQLSHDTQLIKYGTGEPQDDILRRVMESFENAAPADALLVVKVHPMDNALTDWAKLVGRGSASVVFLDGGDLDALLARSAGVVTVNSTVGLTALMAGVPTLALGQAVYRSAGLTSQQSLEAFWQNPQSPESEDVAAFGALLRTQFHVPGAFDGPGAPAGAQALAEWLENPPYLKKEAAE